MRDEWTGRCNGCEWRILQLVTGSGYEITIGGKANYSIHYDSYNKALGAIIQRVTESA